MRIGLVIVAALALGGCKTAAERQAAENREADGFCAGIGAAPGSDAYVRCRLQLREQTSREETARRNAYADAPPFRLQPLQGLGGRQPVTCTTQPMFGSLQTTCN